MLVTHALSVPANCCKVAHLHPVDHRLSYIVLLCSDLLLCLKVMGPNQEAQLMFRLTLQHSTTLILHSVVEDGKAACNVHITPYLLCHCQCGICLGSQISST